MSATCPACSKRPAPNESGKCSPCAAEAVRRWAEKRKAKR